MIEIFTGKPEGIDLAEGQQVVPIKLDADSAGLSAILLNDDDYSLVREQHNEEKEPAVRKSGRFDPFEGARLP